MDRVIKRYQNRKLYDTKNSCYVTLKDIEEMIRQQEQVQVLDNTTGEDITRQILFQIILRTDTVKPVPLEGLMSLVSQGGDRMRRALQKTMEIGKEVVGKVDNTSTGKRGFDLNTVKQLFEKVGEMITLLLNERLRRGLLKIPTIDDWKSIDKKLSLLEQKLTYLKKNREVNANE